jgi:hypothetical protein
MARRTGSRTACRSHVVGSLARQARSTGVDGSCLHRLRRSRPAFAELIEAEYLAAVAMEALPPEQRLYADRPGYVEAVAATLRWAWRQSGPVPDLVGLAPLAPTAIRP